MPIPYYNKIINLFKEIVEQDKISVAEILKIIEDGENKAGITKAWLHSIYNEVPADPGIKRMDALFRVLRKKKQRLNRKN